MEIELSSVILDIAAGPFGSNLKTSCFVDCGFPIIDGANLRGIKVTDNITKYVTEDKARSLHRSIAKRGDVIVTISGTIGQISYIPNDSRFEEYLCSQRQFRVTFNDKKVYVPYIVYYFHTFEGQSKILAFANQVGVPALSQPLKNFKAIKINLPEYNTQKLIGDILLTFTNKIELNNKIITNIEEHINIVFNGLFKNIRNGTNKISDYIIPKRGKNLLSKDAIPGFVPVVAGGLEPSCTHNVANTKSPVITISASGANAGFVAIWGKDVWSSDSSFIDSAMTKNVYFWYCVLKNRQQEIFDSQTGSAQPHIYPQHIGNLSICSLNEKDVNAFCAMTASFFDKVFACKEENEKLNSTINVILPKLMSGDIDVSKVKIED